MTREEAIKILRREIECLSHTKCEDCILEVACDPIKTTPFDSEYIEVYEMAISALSDYDKMQKISLDLAFENDELINKSRWIPVSERLPDNNVRVLCSAISTSISGGYTRFVGCCNKGFWYVQTDADTVSYPNQYKVTAWMPLPEPYKAEKGGE